MGNKTHQLDFSRFPSYSIAGHRAEREDAAYGRACHDRKENITWRSGLCRFLRVKRKDSHRRIQRPQYTARLYLRAGRHSSAALASAEAMLDLAPVSVHEPHQSSDALPMLSASEICMISIMPHLITSRRTVGRGRENRLDNTCTCLHQLVD